MATTTMILWDSNIRMQHGNGLRRYATIAAAVFGLLARLGRAPQSPGTLVGSIQAWAVPSGGSWWNHGREYDADAML